MLVTAAAMTALVGCSSTGEESSEATSATSTATSELPPLPQEEPVPHGAVQVSPDGVTTVVDVPSDATESQYGQACIAAKKWFDEQDGEPPTKVEAYLKTLQAPDASGPGSFNSPWAELTPAQQAGVILAANAAANGECG